ncbi:hypothetical protein LINPERPRIM_LOCUS35699 [Linum perenne]
MTMLARTSFKLETVTICQSLMWARVLYLVFVCQLCLLCRT